MGSHKKDTHHQNNKEFELASDKRAHASKIDLWIRRLWHQITSDLEPARTKKAEDVAVNYMSALYCKLHIEELICTYRSYVDVILRAGGKETVQASQSRLDGFKSKTNNHNSPLLKDT